MSSILNRAMLIIQKMIFLLMVLGISVSCRKPSQDSISSDSKLKQIHYYHFISDPSPTTIEAYEFDLAGKIVVTRFYKQLSNGEYYDATYDSTFYRNGLPAEKIRYARYIPTEPKILSKEVYHYQYGQLIKLENISYNHQLKQYEPYMYTLYSYVGNREMKRELYRINSSGDAIWESVVSQYNTNNQLISERFLNPQQQVKREVVYQYHNNILSVREVHAQGLKIASFEYKYDTNGRKIKETVLYQDPDGGQIEKTEFKY